MIYFISDTHFCNSNIIKYCDRPFQSVTEMNEYLIDRWNSVVEPHDTVFHLGDFIMGNADNVDRILPRLNGDIRLIRGNHDTEAKMSKYLHDYHLDWDYLHHFRYKGFHFILCHYPVFNEELFNLVTKDNPETILLHGHVHDKLPFYTPERRQFNVSADATAFTPVGIDTIIGAVRHGDPMPTSFCVQLWR